VKPTSGGMGDLFAGMPPLGPSREPLAQGAVLLRGFATADAATLLQLVNEIAAIAPFRQMTTPGGHLMSVAMTSCGPAGWVTDRHGYRYTPVDPLTRQRWPPIPERFQALATRAAAESGYSDFAPDACLINRSAIGSRLTLHQDRNERDYTQPIVSVSLGLPAVFLFGGATRGDRPRRIRLESGDVVVWGGPARLSFHGVEPLAAGWDTLTEHVRFNFTFRKAR
jgi:alkylated DNA repair protein (DNA oxidative demethylase)